ncbi:RING/FYVE/PHD zinc finger superfamily protein [Hirschfeldia incana]|nr:RING/FYVE/PHD zinc finger superfamily protein [Hirschfeldia incana]
MKPHEEWVDGSWTVDCVCGVSFDDGKEMVNCDECGVWVHTWCSRYVKGDDLFACHKCKIKSDKLRMSQSLLSQGRSFQSFRECREIPIEERVHVQGVPGGDLEFFGGFSSVFSRQLWKCTGYVPKKFRFRCREFPNLGGQEDGCEGVMLSMFEENDADVVGTNDEKLGGKDRGMEMKRYERDDVNKEKSLLCSLSRDKRRREDFEDRVKKKVKVEDKEEEEDDKNDFGGKNNLESVIGKSLIKR